MSHRWSHIGSHGVTDAVTRRVTGSVRPRGVTEGVTLLQTRPDQTRVFVTAVCGFSNYSIHPSLQAVEGRRCDAWMGANAQIRRWFK